MAEWIDNEEGPCCTCTPYGCPPTIVKRMANGRYLLVCFFHTPEAGVTWDLPPEKPSDWPWPIERCIQEWSRKGDEASDEA